MLAICSSFKNYGVIFEAPGDDFVDFLIGCDSSYLAGRLAGGAPGKLSNAQIDQVHTFAVRMWPLVVKMLEAFQATRKAAATRASGGTHAE